MTDHGPRFGGGRVASTLLVVAISEEHGGERVVVPGVHAVLTYDHPMRQSLAEYIENRDLACQAFAFGFGSTEPCRGPGVFHHRKLRSQGGEDSKANLVLLCDGHHREVHANPQRAMDCKLIVSAYDEPQEWLGPETL